MSPSILAVDDEPDMLRLYERVVKGKTPYEIDSVANSLQVPEIFAARSYDVIQPDLRMRGLNGLEILRMLKEQIGMR
jgi:CheY-like chemotaxis protein